MSFYKDILYRQTTIMLIFRSNNNHYSLYNNDFRSPKSTEIIRLYASQFNKRGFLSFDNVKIIIVFSHPRQNQAVYFRYNS